MGGAGIYIRDPTNGEMRYATIREPAELPSYRIRRPLRRSPAAGAKLRIRKNKEAAYSHACAIRIFYRISAIYIPSLPHMRIQVGRYLLKCTSATQIDNPTLRGRIDILTFRRLIISAAIMRPTRFRSAWAISGIPLELNASLRTKSTQVDAVSDSTPLTHLADTKRRLRIPKKRAGASKYEAHRPPTATPATHLPKPRTGARIRYAHPAAPFGDSIEIRIRVGPPHHHRPPTPPSVKRRRAKIPMGAFGLF